jgi:hypothetical protein
LLVLAEGACLAQELVDQGGLAMIDVSDDGDITDGAGHCGVPEGGAIEKLTQHSSMLQRGTTCFCSE